MMPLRYALAPLRSTVAQIFERIMKHPVSNDELCYLSEKTVTGSTVAEIDSVDMLWFGTHLYLVTVYVCVLCLLRIC